MTPVLYPPLLTPSIGSYPPGLDEYIKSLLHFDGPDGINIITDWTGKAWTAYGDTQLDDGRRRFGSAAIFFDGTGDYMDTPDHEDFNVGSGDFTIDCWIRTTSFLVQEMAFGQVDSALTATTRSIDLQVWTDGKIYATVGSAGNSISAVSNAAISLNTWYHVAMVRSGNTLTLYINGVAQTTTGNLTGITVNNSSNKFAIGRRGEYAGAYWSGWIDEFRFSKGVARWTSNFLPPAMAYGDTSRVDDAYTKTLLHFTGPDATWDYFDETGRPWYSYGNAQIDTGHLHFHDHARDSFGSLLLDGAGDYIAAPDHADFDFGSGDFTIDFWVRLNALTGTFVTKRVSAAVRTPFACSMDGTYVYFMSSADGSAWDALMQWAHAGQIATGIWYHMAFVRNGSSWKFYLNGVEKASATSSHTVMTNTTAVTVGCVADGATAPLNGSLDELRISKGIARWTANFTPPAYEYGSVSGLDDAYSVALLHFDEPDASLAIVDQSGKVWTPSGNAQIEQAYYRVAKKKNYGCLWLDGTGDYIYTDGGSDFAFGTGDFTIDFWMRSSDLTGAHLLYDGRPLSTQGAYVSIYTSGTSLRLFVNSADRITGATVLTTNVWYHVAIVRSGTSTKMYLNGVQEGSTYTDTNNYISATSRPLVGASGVDATYGFAGWIDELRISKGIARWIANFTPQVYPYAETTGLDDAYTKVLLHGYGLNSGPVFHDDSGKLWSRAGNSETKTDQSKFGGVSIFFDGTGDYISTPDHDDVNFGSGDFTLDFWVRFNSLAANRGIYNQYQTANDQIRLFWATTNYLVLDAYSGGAAVVNMSRSWTPSINTWYHVAISRSGSNWYMFVNGVQIGTTYSNAGSLPDLVSPAYVGVADIYYMNGWIDEFRLSKGVARWTANFTPPTSEY